MHASMTTPILDAARHPAAQGSPREGRAPRVSVIMATYNGSAYIEYSIRSLLTQTMQDFEIIVVDDCSTDDTHEVLRAIADPRLRVIRNAENIGVVRSRNRCFEAARGEYVAMLDHDDLSLPTRLHKQVAYLDAHPDTVLVGTSAHTTESGRMGAPRHDGPTTPSLIGWLLLIANPLVCSSVMFRASVARRLGEFLREGYAYADDYDLYQRLALHGRIARVDEPLTIYRLHGSNASRKHEHLMTMNAARALTPSYARWIGAEAEAAAELVATHLASCKPARDLETLRRLQGYLVTVTRNYVSQTEVGAEDARAIRAQADMLWERTVTVSARESGLSIPADVANLFGTGPGGTRLGRARLSVRWAIDRMPFQRSVRSTLHRLSGRAARLPRTPSVVVSSAVYRPADVATDRVPTLFVVVDTEAEFDWAKPFSRDLNTVEAADHLGRGQAVFDRYGLKPLYVVDYPIATNPKSVARIRDILARDACEIGAHLHPWTTPPYEEDLSNRNSFPGNLPAEIEDHKLGSLVQAIEQSFGRKALFYKAGRYGVGAATASALAAHGIRVDLSILPGADLTRNGGPDFSLLLPRPYWLGDTGVLSVPMTRSTIGLAPWLGRLASRMEANRVLRHVPVTALLARCKLSDTVTLTPEGVTAQEQIRLIKALLKRGTRQFVMHYHSPSLALGHTSYTKTQADLDEFLGRLSQVCRYFFEELGGMPGNPADLVPRQQRAAASRSAA